MEDEIEELKIIIKNILGVDVMEIKRKREVVDARRIYSKILYDRHYTHQSIGDSIGKNHSSIIYYIKNIDILFNQENTFFSQYITCRDLFLDGKEFIDGAIKPKRVYLTNKELRDKIAELVLERENVLNLKAKYSRLENIIDLIDSNLKKGDEYLLENKLNSILSPNKYNSMHL